VGSVLLAPALLAGCGGSGNGTSPSSASTASTSRSTGAATSAAPPSATAADTAATSTSAATTGRPPEVPAAQARTPSASHRGAPDTNVRVPARFVVGSGGTLTPPAVSVPAGITIALGLLDRDGRPHTVVLAAPPRHSFALAAGGRASATLSGLPKGTYRILVDGVVRGQIVIGSAPGP
jgi:hypothetical protein